MYERLGYSTTEEVRCKLRSADGRHSKADTFVQLTATYQSYGERNKKKLVTLIYIFFPFSCLLWHRYILLLFFFVNTHNFTRQVTPEIELRLNSSVCNLSLTKLFLFVKNEMCEETCNQWPEATWTERKIFFPLTTVGLLGRGQKCWRVH